MLMQDISCCITDLFTFFASLAGLGCSKPQREAGSPLWRMQPLGFVSAQQSEDESGLKRVDIISGQLNSCRVVLSQASSDIFSCHFIFFTELKSFLLMIFLDFFWLSPDPSP